ncbi:acetolactate synthase 2 small subunit [Endozoicomonas sp. 4G]|uniref:acetolactate synthase 2 small subunit n=1 Tax=Endozoicomonas sp. 4G TaxID=2872754 RepID=UPI002078DB82|nr:acetolactate synthase 2 small subunit [Endozoicomonas sp. 4G]
MSDSRTHFALTIQCRKTPEVMERLLRVVRHRGFELQRFSMTSAECGKIVSADLEVCSERSIEMLTRQIEKLYDVLQVHQSTTMAAMPQEKRSHAAP